MTDYASREARLVEMLSAWHARADSDAVALAQLNATIAALQDRIRELEWTNRQISELYDLAKERVGS